MAEKISKTQHLTLKVFHFHFGGTINNINHYIKGYSNILDVYCQLKKEYNSLEYFDFGGGFPVSYSLDDNFDYDLLVDKMIDSTLKVCSKNKTECPNLIGEHGRFTVADSGFLIYKVDFTKKDRLNNWYIINGSLMTMTPDLWALSQNFTILPINLYENKFLPICLGGETCDPDDRYFIDDKNTKVLMPKLEENQTLYIAIFGTGAYQEILSGIGGLHHCLIPEGNELIIYKRNDKFVYLEAEKVTNSKKVYDILDYDDKKYMKNFFKKKKR